MIHRETLEEIPLVLDDGQPSLLVSVEFDVEYEIVNAVAYGSDCDAISVTNIEPVTLTFDKFVLYCRFRKEPIDKELLEALADHIDAIAEDAENGDLSVKLIERGDD